MQRASDAQQWEEVWLQGTAVLHTPPTLPILHPREHRGEGASNVWGLAFRPRSQRHVPGSPQPGSGSCSGCPVHATHTWCCSSPRSTQLDHPDSWLSLPPFSAAMRSSFRVPTFEVRETEEGRGFAMVTPWLVVSQFCQASPSILRDQPPHG